MSPLPTQDLHILRLAFLAHLTQLLASLPPFSLKTREGFRSPPAKDCRALLDLLQVQDTSTPVTSCLMN